LFQALVVGLVVLAMAATYEPPASEVLADGIRALFETFTRPVAPG
jgi:hypothetical protein